MRLARLYARTFDGSRLGQPAEALLYRCSQEQHHEDRYILEGEIVAHVGPWHFSGSCDHCIGAQIALTRGTERMRWSAVRAPKKQYQQDVEGDPVAVWRRLHLFRGLGHPNDLAVLPRLISSRRLDILLSPHRSAGLRDDCPRRRPCIYDQGRQR